MCIRWFRLSKMPWFGASPQCCWFEPSLTHMWDNQVVHMGKHENFQLYSLFSSTIIVQYNYVTSTQKNTLKGEGQGILWSFVASTNLFGDLRVKKVQKRWSRQFSLQHKRWLHRSLSNLFWHATYSAFMLTGSFVGWHNFRLSLIGAW